jgi:hypothetical protein
VLQRRLAVFKALTISMLLVMSCDDFPNGFLQFLVKNPPSQVSVAGKAK